MSFASNWNTLLPRWLAFGLAWWLAGMLVLPTSKLYQQGLILLFWLPGLLALLTSAQVRRGWWQPASLLLGLFALWSAASLLWSETPADPGELKIFLYVALATNAVLALACLDPERLWRSLAMLGLLVGLLAWLSLQNLYGLELQPWTARAVGTGLVNHPILAGQLFGIMGILLLCLRQYLPTWLKGVPWYVSLAGYLAFLLMTQSRGPWIAVCATILLAPFWERGFRPLALAGATCLALLVVAWFWPDLLLQRGFSYRPDLIEQALLKIQEHPWLGIGFASPYLLPVPAQGVSYEHAHNLYLHIAVLLGMVGLAGWLLLHGWAALWAWRLRDSVQGRLCLSLLCFAGIALFTDGVGPWVKPREEWFCLWLPLFLCMAGAALRNRACIREREIA